jgi:hypothetical protein
MHLPRAMVMRAFFLADEKLLALRLGNFAEAGFAPCVAKSKGLAEIQSQVSVLLLRKRPDEPQSSKVLQIRLQ